MSSEPAPSRCRQCGSRLRPDDEWCSLCLTPVRAPAPVEPVLPSAARTADQPAPETVRVSAGHPAGPARPPVTAVDPEVIAVADRMLAELALASAVERNTGLHRLLARTAERTGLSGTGAGLVLAAAGAGVFLVVLIVALTLVGLLA